VDQILINATLGNPFADVFLEEIEEMKEHRGKVYFLAVEVQVDNYSKKVMGEYIFQTTSKDVFLDLGRIPPVFALPNLAALLEVEFSKRDHQHSLLVKTREDGVAMMVTRTVNQNYAGALPKQVTFTVSRAGH
jgi:hypothetical protein